MKIVGKLTIVCKINTKKSVRVNVWSVFSHYSKLFWLFFLFVDRLQWKKNYKKDLFRVERRTYKCQTCMRMWYRKVEGDGEKQRIRMRSLRNKYSTVAHRISTLVLLFTISYVFASLFSIGKTVAWVSLTLRLATVANDWCCLHGQPHHSLD